MTKAWQKVEKYWIKNKFMSGEQLFKTLCHSFGDTTQLCGLWKSVRWWKCCFINWFLLLFNFTSHTRWDIFLRHIIWVYWSDYCITHRHFSNPSQSPAWVYSLLLLSLEIKMHWQLVHTKKMLYGVFRNWTKELTTCIFCFVWK